MRRDTTARKGWRGTGLNPFAEPNATWAPAPAPTSGWRGDPFPPYGAGEAGATLDEIAAAERRPALATFGVVTGRVYKVAA